MPAPIAPPGLAATTIARISRLGDTTAPAPHPSGLGARMRLPVGTTVGGLIAAAALLSATEPSATIAGTIVGGAGRVPLGMLASGTHSAVAVGVLAGLLIYVQSLYAGVRTPPSGRN
jgi:hypothetical protein